MSDYPRTAIWRDLHHRIALLLFFLVSCGFVVVAVANPVPFRGGSTILNRFLFAGLGATMIFYSGRALLREWRDITGALTCGTVSVTPRTAGHATLGSLAGIGPAWIDVEADLAGVKAADAATLVFKVSVAWKNESQSHRFGYKPVPKDAQPKSFRVSRSAPEEFEDSAWRYNLACEGPWTAEVHLDFDPETNYDRPFDLRIVGHGQLHPVDVDGLSSQGDGAA